MTIYANDNPKLAAAVRAALKTDAPTRAPLDPNHSPFGHVRLSARGGGWSCGLCGRDVVAVSFDEWSHH